MTELMLGASSFITELLYISKDIVWKDEATAQANERDEDRIYVEQYIAACQGILSFDTIYQFEAETLIELGMEPEVAIACNEDKRNIPENLRSLAVQVQVKRIIQNYEERNNYYRMLNGLPDMGDTKFIYNTKYPDISDSTTPIHELPITILYNLENMGYLDELYKENPTKKYLLHMGSKKISSITARLSSRFSILYVNSSEFTRINTAFRDTYNACRYALLRSVYVGEMRKENPLYDNFFALCILFMTIQQMHAKYLDADITRDFYDYESLKYVYDSYGVPFYSSIPLEYHVKIVKNINLLMSHKGSTKVFFELFDIFNFGSMDVFDFYILKSHKFVNGMPVFKYNEDGTEDKRAMYELKFGQVRLYNNPPLELSDPANYIPYDVMTENDPYWIHDKDLLDKLYDNEFNYLETKYIGIRTIFDLMNIMMETCYLFKMIQDNRESTKYVNTYFSALNMNIDFFTMIIYICALVCARYKYTPGTLAGNPAMIAKVMGFNYSEDLDKIKEDILADPDLSKDKELYQYLMNMRTSSVSLINNTFSNIISLHNLFTERKMSAKNRRVFEAYDHLQKILMTSNYMDSVFKKKDGKPATDFADLLADINADLYLRYADIVHPGESNNVNIELLNSEVDTVVATLKQSIYSLKYIEMGTSSNSNVMIEHLFKLLDFFKSAKAELTGYDIEYRLAKRGDAMIKFFAEEKDGIAVRYEWDEIRFLQFWHKIMKEWYWNKDEVHWAVKMDEDYLRYVIDTAALRLKFKIHLIQMKFIVDNIGNLELNDIMEKVHMEYLIQDGFSLNVRLDLLYEKIIYEGLDFLINDGFENLEDRVHKICTENKICNDEFMQNEITLTQKIKYHTNGSFESSQELEVEENNRYQHFFDNHERELLLKEACVRSAFQLMQKDICNIQDSMNENPRLTKIKVSCLFNDKLKLISQRIVE